MAGYIGKSQGKILTNVEGNSVETVDIQDSAVTETKIAAGSVTDTKLNSTKLNGIEAGATADQTGAEIKAAYEAEADTNAFTDAEKTKLSGIEAGADVTDTANVTAAGALMDSEVTNLAQVKAFSSADYATAAQGALADSALQDITGESIEDLSDVATMTPTDGQLLTWDSATSKWNAEDAPVSLPDQTGQSGKYLTTNGTDASWGTVDLSSKLDTTATFGGDVSGTYNAIVIADDSHNHIISNVDGLQTALDGKQPLATVLTNTTASYTTAEETKLAGIESGATADQTASEILTAIKTVDGSGSGLDADTVDGVHESSFMRKSANSALDMNNNNITDVEDIYLQDRIYHDGDTDTYMQFHAADQWRVVTGGSERLEVNNSGCTVSGNLSVTGSISGAGKVLQVVQTKKTSFFSTSSTSYVDVSGASATITPSSTSSKILVTITGASSNNGSNGFAYGQLTRGSTNIAIGDSRGSAQRCTFDLAQQSAGDPNNWAKPFAITYLDSPSTTSATTYKLRVKRTINNIGIGGTYTTIDGNRSSVPTILTLMEIAG